MISWFKTLPNKQQLKFIQFDLCEFYSNISDQLIQKSIEFAGNYVTISEDDKKMFFQTKQSFLFHDCQPWINKQNSECDVTMGSFDGAETCELCDLYLLSLLVKVIPDLGIYRDDGLAVTRSTARQTETDREVFEDEGLWLTVITVIANMQHI